MTQKSSNNVNVELNPWSNSGFKINKVHIVETIGGDLPFGTIYMIFDNKDDKALNLLTNEQTGILKIINNKDNGSSFEIPIFITDRTFLESALTINFVCIDKKEFITLPCSMSFENITDAINYLYEGKKDIRIESDINNEANPIIQTCETNYELCTKLLYSFKKESVFAYAWDKLIVKDLCGEYDSFGNKEPNIIIRKNALMYPTTGFNLKYDKLINRKPYYNPWTEKDMSVTGNIDYTDKEPENCKVIVNDSNYFILGKKYEQMIYNYNYNKSIINAKLYSTLKINGTDIPNYRICDVITLKDNDNKIPLTKYLVAANELFWSVEGTDEISPHGYPFEWMSTLWGLDNGNWTKDIEN